MKKIGLIIIGLVLVVGLVLVLGQRGLSTKKESKLLTSGPETIRIKDRGVLRVGVDATFYPMEFVDENDQIDGFGVELARKIAKEFGVDVEIKNITWDKIFDELDQGNIDLIVSSVTINSERSKTMLFSKPYLNAGQAIVVLKNNNLIKDTSTLEGKVVGFQFNTTSEIEVKKLTDKPVSFVDYDVATSKLLGGEIEAMIIDYPAAIGKVKRNPELKIVGGPFTQEFYGIVVSKGNEALLQSVNKVIENLILTGEMKKIENIWLK